ncbi:MAG: hypothetical protein KBA72_06180 [Thermoanaerobaculia bacterium]|nr:hypothetical protein [Thermoanaerobaculia bacterium]
MSKARRTLGVLALTCSILVAAAPARPQTAAAPHALFVWAGDREKKGNDFLLVIDADPRSPQYGRMLTALATDQRTVRPHHTEYTMPESGMLFVNDHDAGRSFILDVRDPLRPAVAGSFEDMAGFAHPHSYLRLPNGHVLVSFQHDAEPKVPFLGHAAPMASMSSAAMGKTGGLVEIDDLGRVVRSSGNADAAFADNVLMPYSLVVLPQIDRVVSTNSSMHDPDLFSGTTYQVWRLSDLRLLKTAYFDPGERLYAHISPEEPRVGPDGSVFVQTLACGLERITGIATDAPVAKLVHTFPGNFCGVPTIVGRFFVQSVPAVHGFIVLDLADPAHPVEVSRLTISDLFRPHWTGWDPATGRIVATPGSEEDNRMYLLQLDPKTGALTVDDTFRDTDGKTGFSFAKRVWPHGWEGAGLPHGAVFSR